MNICFRRVGVLWKFREVVILSIEWKLVQSASNAWSCEHQALRPNWKSVDDWQSSESSKAIRKPKSPRSWPRPSAALFAGSRLAVMRARKVSTPVRVQDRHPDYLASKSERCSLSSSRARAIGFVTELWTAQRIAKLILDHFGVRFHSRSINAWLTQRGVSPQKPRRVPRERDEARIEAWLAKVWPRILKKGARRKAHIVLVDETGCLVAPLVRRTQAPRGKTPILILKQRGSTVRRCRSLPLCPFRLAANVSASIARPILARSSTVPRRPFSFVNCSAIFVGM